MKPTPAPTPQPTPPHWRAFRCYICDRPTRAPGARCSFCIARQSMLRLKAEQDEPTDG